MPLLADPASTFRIAPYLELRERVERRVNRDFGRQNADDRNDLLSRWRLGASFDLGQGFMAELRYQFANDQFVLGRSDSATTNSDVDLAYLSHRLGAGKLTLGRQKINVGNQRLVGSLEWVNVPRSYDGVRFQSGAWDGFAVSLPGGAPGSRRMKLAGLTNANRLGLTSVILKHDDLPTGKVDLVTLDQIAARRFGRWGFDFEGALQTGRTGGRRQFGWAVHTRVERTLDRRTSAFVDGNAASGGDGPNAVGTFDNISPSNHRIYGLADMQGWRNVAHLALGLERRVATDVSARLCYHRFGLLNGSDAWYNAPGAINGRPGGVYRDPSGRSGRDVGQEWDLEATWSGRRPYLLSAGIAAFLPGNFVRRLAGQETRPQTFAYAQFQIRF